MSLSLLRSLFITAPLIVLATALYGSFSLLVALFDRDGRKQHRVARAWARALLVITRVRVTVEGQENVSPHHYYVFAANHLSYMDIPVLLPYLPAEFRFMAKHGLWKVPLLGHHLQTAGHLPVVADDPRASLRTMKEAARIIEEKKISVLVFPEGGRNPGPLGPFREGVGYIAIKAGAPIIPVALIGTREVLPMDSLHLRGGDVTLRIGEAIPTDTLAIHDRMKVTQIARDRVAELMGGEEEAEARRQESAVRSQK